MADVPFAFIRDMMAAALGVEAHLLRPPYKDAQEFDYRLSRILRADFDYKDIFSASAMHGLEEGTVYYVHNTLELNYVFMPVPGPKPRSVLLFGPFLYEAASGPFFERVLAQNRIGKGDAAALRTFYGTVPEVAEPTMAAAAHAVACQLYGAHDPARVVHRTLASTVTGRAQPDEAFQFSMELLERRYRDENALLAAVSRGDYDAAVRHLGRFSIKNFTPRTGELLRDVKNMLIVVNTLLRKAAESGGVHPVYIDQLSGALAVKIERVADTMEANRLGLEMLRRYCRLVRNDAHSGCSQAVQKTLSYISLHLSGELSLRSIAAALGFNEIQFDYVRFPDNTDQYEASGDIDFRNEYGETKAQAIQRFLMYATDILHEYGVYVGADVFGETSGNYVTAYGQYWPAISNVVDVISGMPYPDHFARNGAYRPWEHPYETLLDWAESAAKRQAETPTPAVDRTWIQAYNAIQPPYNEYGVQEIGDEIRGLREQGFTGGFMAWNASCSLTKLEELRPLYEALE